MDKSIHSRKYKIAISLLKEARIVAGITQIQLAVKLDETQTFISKYERGERRLDIIEVRSICEAMDVNFIEFIKAMEKELNKLR